MGARAKSADELVERKSALGSGSRMTAEQQERHRKLKSWFWQEMRRQAANRYQMALDEDYYDSKQWEAQEAAVVIARGQFPVSWNEIKPTIDWLIGTERRTRTDFNIISRNDDSEPARKEAQAKTKLLKYLHDVNRTSFERSTAANSAFKAGLGWIECAVRGDPEQEPIYTRAESWRNMLYDSLGERLDCEDWRYQFRFKWLDLDVAKAFFPGKEKALEAAACQTDDQQYMQWWHGKRIDEWGGFDHGETMLPSRWTMYDPEAWQNNQRDRVLIIEAWSREPSTVQTGHGSGAYDRTYMRTRLTLMTDMEILEDDWSPYTHNRFPFIPVWCYRATRDGAPYGAIRALRGPQDATNKAMSKAIWEVSANQIAVESDAIDPKLMNLQQVVDEAQSPDGAVVLAPGGLNKFKQLSRSGKAQDNIAIAQQGTQSIRSMSGVTGENRGIETSENQSGKAVLARQEQGSLLTAEIFDNLLLSRQLEGEITLSLIEQFILEPKTFSIAGDRQKYNDYTKINTPDPATGQIVNDVTRIHHQYVIGEQAWRQSIMQASFESMLDMLSKIAGMAPDVVLKLLPFAMELGDYPNKASLMKAVWEATGQADPDEEMTPEQQAAVAQGKALKEAQFNAQMADLQAKVKEAQAKGKKLDSEALLKVVTAMYEALQAAQVAATVPHVTPIADAILKASGFLDQAGQDPDIPAPAVAAPVQQVQALPALQQTDGAARGIETPRLDGVGAARPEALPPA